MVRQSCAVDHRGSRFRCRDRTGRHRRRSGSHVATAPLCFIASLCGFHSRIRRKQRHFHLFHQRLWPRRGYEPIRCKRYGKIRQHLGRNFTLLLSRNDNSDVWIRPLRLHFVQPPPLLGKASVGSPNRRPQ